MSNITLCGQTLPIKDARAIQEALAHLLAGEDTLRGRLGLCSFLARDVLDREWGLEGTAPIYRIIEGLREGFPGASRSYVDVPGQMGPKRRAFSKYMSAALEYAIVSQQENTDAN